MKRVNLLRNNFKTSPSAKPIALICLFLFGGATYASAAEYHILVALGNDQGLNKAVSAARAHRATQPSDTIIIDLPPSVNLTQPLQLDGRDSGSSSAPLIFQGAAKDGTLISGLANLPLRPLSSADNIAFPFPASVGVVDLSALSTSTNPQPFLTNNGLPLVFLRGRRQTPARWPRYGYATGPHVVNRENGNASLLSVRGLAALKIEAEQNAYVAGYWSFNWNYETSRLTPISNDYAQLNSPKFGVKPTARYFLYNLSSQLNYPDSYYFDNQDNRIYVFLPNRQPVGGIGVASTRQLLTVKSAQNIRFQNVSFAYSVETSVVIQNAINIRLDDCAIAHAGGDGVDIVGGANDQINRSVVSDIGGTGVLILAGDRTKLIPANSGVYDSIIEKFGQSVPTYNPGVRLLGVGNHLTRSEIADGRHAGVLFGGNDQDISLNLVHDLVTDTSDAGAIYSGRSFSERGSQVASNYVYNVVSHLPGEGVFGIYLDDQMSGVTVRNNIFENVDTPILLGGGRDNIITSNIILSAKMAAVKADSRGLSWEKNNGKLSALNKSLTDVPALSPLYTQRYAGLANVLTDNPGAPVGNTIENNIVNGVDIVSYDDPSTGQFVRPVNNIKLHLSLASGNLCSSLPVIAAASPDKSTILSLRSDLIIIQSTLANLRLRFDGTKLHPGNSPQSSGAKAASC